MDNEPYSLYVEYYVDFFPLRNTFGANFYTRVVTRMDRCQVCLQPSTQLTLYWNNIPHRLCLGLTTEHGLIHPEALSQDAMVSTVRDQIARYASFGAECPLIRHWNSGLTSHSFRHGTCQKCYACDFMSKFR